MSANPGGGTVASGALVAIIGFWLLMQTMAGDLARRLVSYATSPDTPGDPGSGLGGAENFPPPPAHVNPLAPFGPRGSSVVTPPGAFPFAPGDRFYAPNNATSSSVGHIPVHRISTAAALQIAARLERHESTTLLVRRTRSGHWSMNAGGEWVAVRPAVDAPGQWSVNT